ncbi:mobile mystery protein B [Leptospira wolffii]|uniref:mobile mystery protein B n=1 Tax=Leptospira wolffii TaxID=409998 RepID=UPI001083101C|nr:mobile mystery protein B [Leptospira wolffii]TGK61624.1 mobile mystery protein B [Leptospira wolffii]TGK70168.1 mobile mystery protein B [Leptospira wolffii]TGK77091.1 mobile mystery protein B [Leptospira wolffii]TGL31057.1 mobile mystery protein B [Leptospira wolffii]
MGLDDDSLIAGQTPIDPDEKNGLKIRSISILDELNEWEQWNIEKAVEWSMRKRFSRDTILQMDFVDKLHKRMFGEVWGWAGTHRKTNKNIGVDKFQISSRLSGLLSDCRFWIENGTYGGDEIAIRFKHRIVSIHCYPNGNGRHSRLMADIIVTNLFNLAPFSWGRFSSFSEDLSRKKYLEALRDADRGDLSSLIRFARS